jgi:hypothetical protein
MSINETAVRRSNLSAQQIRDAERAIFGVPNSSEEPRTDDMTLEEVAKMRQLVYAHDRQHQKMETIDLNNPPPVRYQYREYPRMVFQNGERDKFAIVQNVVQLEVAILHGYTIEPAPPEPPPSAADLLPHEWDDQNGEDQHEENDESPPDDQRPDLAGLDNEPLQLPAGVNVVREPGAPKKRR